MVCAIVSSNKNRAGERHKYPNHSIEGQRRVQGSQKLYRTIRVEREFDGETVLAADRLHLLEVKISHVTGNYWLVHFFRLKKFLVVAYAGEFEIGVDGQAAGLRLQLSTPGDEINEGSVWFERVN